MILESACIPVPSEAIMLYGGFLVSRGDESLIAMIGAGVLGNVIGSWIAYWIGRWQGPRVGAALALAAHHARALDAADRWFARYGDWAVLLSRCLPIVRTFISLPAGIARMPFWRFTLFTLIGCIPWVTALALPAGRSATTGSDLQQQLHYLDYALVVAIVGGVVWLVVRRRRRRRAPAAPRPSRRPPRGRGGGLTVDAEAMRRFAVERVEALFNRGEADRVEEFVTPDFVDHEAWPGEDPGYEGFRLRLRRLHEAISDLHMEVHEVLAEGDLVAYRATLSGTHTGPAARHPGDGTRLQRAAHPHAAHARRGGERALGGARRSGDAPAARGDPAGVGLGHPDHEVEAPCVVEGLSSSNFPIGVSSMKDLGERVAPRQLDAAGGASRCWPGQGGPS